MAILDELQSRAGGQCELCGGAGAGTAYAVPPVERETTDGCVLVCDTCSVQLAPDAKLDVHHWRALNETMWSQVPAVQVMAWRTLQRLSDEDWARDLSDMLYLDDDLMAWAQKDTVASHDASELELRHIDSNGVELAAGDTVVLIKDLNVKGTSFVAKRGTAVRGIRLDPNNEAHIEGRVNGQQIVILTEFVKKSG